MVKRSSAMSTNDEIHASLEKKPTVILREEWENNADEYDQETLDIMGEILLSRGVKLPLGSRQVNIPTPVNIPVPERTYATVRPDPRLSPSRASAVKIPTPHISIGTPSREAEISGGITRVIVEDIDMPFYSMIFFMVKWTIASIPAFIILFIFSLILMFIGHGLGFF